MTCNVTFALTSVKMIFFPTYMQEIEEDTELTD